MDQKDCREDRAELGADREERVSDSRGRGRVGEGLIVPSIELIFTGTSGSPARSENTMSTTPVACQLPSGRLILPSCHQGKAMSSFITGGLRSWAGLGLEEAAGSSVSRFRRMTAPTGRRAATTRCRRSVTLLGGFGRPRFPFLRKAGCVLPFGPLIAQPTRSLIPRGRFGTGKVNWRNRQNLEQHANRRLDY